MSSILNPSLKKERPRSSDNLWVRFVEPDEGMPEGEEKLSLGGLDQTAEAEIYLFHDVLEELIFAAHALKNKNDAFGLLCGGLFEDAVGEEAHGGDKKQKKALEYVEISAFREIFPVRESLDYAAFLRRDKSLLHTTDYGRVTGIVCLSDAQHCLSLEDVFLMRTYFNLPWQVMLFISGDGTAACYRMNEEGMMYRTGFYIVSLPHDVVNSERLTVHAPSQNT